MLALDQPLPLGTLTIATGPFGWELRRLVSRDGVFEIEAVASPRWRDVLEAGRIDALRRGIAPQLAAELRGSAELWPRPVRGGDPLK